MGLAVPILAPLSAQAHAGDAVWLTLDPVVLAGIGLAGLAYLIGARRHWQRRGVRRLAAHGYFATGMLALCLALIWPLDALSERSLAAHMLQHMVLMQVVPPLLVLGAVVTVAPLWPRPVRALWRIATRPFIAFALHSAVLWVWHAPALYQAALRSDVLHTLEHLSFLVTGLMFWAALMFSGRARADGYGNGALLMLAMIMHTGLLGALLTFAPRPLYDVYAHGGSVFGLTALEDQQLAGLLMWIPGGMVYLLAGLALAAAWFRQAQRRDAACALGRERSG